MLTRILTLFHRHQWSAWKDVKDGYVVNEVGDRVAYYVRQEKRCAGCGKLKMRIERVHAC